MNPSVKPVFKNIYYVRVMEGGSLRIGELLPHRAVEIEDEDGLIAALLARMDGTRSWDELLRELQRGWPALTAEELMDMARELDRLGYLDDAAKKEASGLSQAELDRFKANLNYFSFFSSMSDSPWDMQKRLQQARVTVIGAGTLGSGVLYNLAGLGVKQVRLVDFDAVERSNLNRQLLYNEQDLGRSKIEAAADYLGRLYSDMRVETLNLQIDSVSAAKRVAEGSDLVVLAADQPQVMLESWVNQACVALRIPFMGGGVHIVQGQWYTVIPGKTGCIQCNHLLRSSVNTEQAGFMHDYLSSGFRLPSTAIAANYMLLIGAVSGEIARFFTRMAPLPSEGKVLAMDFLTYSTVVQMDFSKPVPHCSVCGGPSSQN